MSDAEFEKITNRAGSGAPNFTYGLNSGGSDSGLAGFAYTASGTEPSSPANGDVWFDTSNDKYYTYINGEFKQLTHANPVTMTWGGDRAVMQYGTTNGQGTLNYYDITTTGNASSFGNLSQGRHYNGALSDSTKVVWAGGYANDATGYVDTMDYVTASTTGNASDFGNLSANSSSYPEGTSNGTRGIFAGMFANNVIEYITVATPSNSTDFGDLVGSMNKGNVESNGSRGVFLRPSNSFDYVSIDTTGNASSFGTANTVQGQRCSGSNDTYAVFAGGDESYNNAIEYITTATLGNGTDFGDLAAGTREGSGTSNATRMTINGGRKPSASNTIEYVEIATPANAQDFGDLLGTTDSKRSGASGSPS